MTLNNPQRLFPILVVAGLILLSKLLSFNGLYGQDAHEYLRLSENYFYQLRGVSSASDGAGHSELAGGYPMVGALLRFLIPDSRLAMQVVSWLAAGLAVWMFERLLRLWAPGTSPRSRVAYTGLILVMSPYFIRAGITVMSDALGLVFFLAAMYWGLQVLESGRNKGAIWAAVFTGLAIITRLTTAAFMLPFVMAIGWDLLRRRQFGQVLVAFLAGIAALAPHFYFGVMDDLSQNVFSHATLRDWSVSSFFTNTFINVNGTLRYFLPNALYVLAPLAHPGFCLPVSLLFLMAKKTDFHHASQRILLLCLAFCLIFVAGLPVQNMRYLLPAYIILLLFLFPAWDRFFSYGFYFFKRLTWAIIGVVLLIQVVGTAGVLRHPIKRNRLETTIATEVRPFLPPDATIYSFDMDIAMHTYFPDLQIKNMWVTRYSDLSSGSFMLFNESGLKDQWQGKNPMLNWDFARQNYEFQTLCELPEGWALYEVGAKK